MELEINDEKKVIDMCKAIEDMKATSRREGIEEGKINNIKAFYENGVTVEVIAKLVKLSVEKVREVLGINLSVDL